MTYYQISHFERPDSSYPDYDSYFFDDDDIWGQDDSLDEDDLYYGYDDFDEEYEVYDDRKMAAVVDEYCGEDADKVVEYYYRMGELWIEEY